MSGLGFALETLGQREVEGFPILSYQRQRTLNNNHEYSKNSDLKCSKSGDYGNLLLRGLAFNVDYSVAMILFINGLKLLKSVLVLWQYGDKR